MTTLLAIDPGGTTGYALFELHDDAPIELTNHGQIHGGVDGFVKWWRKACEGGAPWDIVVSENFILDGRTPNPDVTPLRVEGALAVLWPGAVIYQRNALKRHAPDALLKKRGLWLKGQPHATDAVRHAIAYAKTRKHRPTLEWLWPVPPGV